MPTSPTPAFGDPTTVTKASSTRTGMPKTMTTTLTPTMGTPIANSICKQRWGGLGEGSVEDLEAMRNDGLVEDTAL